MRQAPLSQEVIKAYLLGALHDGTFSSNKRFRISQKGTEWLKILQKLLAKIGYNAWIYKEGSNRKVYVLESLIETGKIHNPSKKVDLIIGECIFGQIRKKHF